VLPPLLDRAELSGDAPSAAVRLLGGLLVARPVDADDEQVVLRLTEVEAYAGEGDPASHAARGWTPRTAVMFGPAGHAYVYLSYGIHWCLNVSCGPSGRSSAVLLRAATVVSGLETVRRRRPAVRDDTRLARGPGVLTLAAAVSAELGGADLLAGRARVGLRRPPEPVDPASIRSGPRVGVSGAADVPWRFWIAGEPSVSTYRRSAAASPAVRSSSRPSGRLDPGAPGVG